MLVNKFSRNMFAYHLSQAILWSEKYFDYQNIKDSLRRIPHQFDLCTIDDVQIYSSVLEQISSKRSVLMLDSELMLEVIKRLFSQRLGKLLIFYHSLSTSDGTANLITKEFLDVCDFPPCDSWVYCGFELDRRSSKSRFGNKSHNVRYIISYIPYSIIDNINIAILASADEQFDWLENCHFNLSILDELAETKILDLLDF